MAHKGTGTGQGADGMSKSARRRLRRRKKVTKDGTDITVEVAMDDGGAYMSGRMEAAQPLQSQNEISSAIMGAQQAWELIRAQPMMMS
eukprot:11669602-Karenia_brevis.AAC.1